MYILILIEVDIMTYGWVFKLWSELDISKLGFPSPLGQNLHLIKSRFGSKVTHNLQLESTLKKGVLVRITFFWSPVNTILFPVSINIINVFFKLVKEALLKCTK